MPAKKNDGFTAEERAAMKERAQETKKRARGADAKAEDLRDVIEKIEGMAEPDRELAHHIHELLTQTAPDLAPRLWYGMPAYAKDGKVVCFFQGSTKFKTRYSTLGFSDQARLDDGSMWPTVFAITEWNKKVSQRVKELVQQATA